MLSCNSKIYYVFSHGYSFFFLIVNECNEFGTGAASFFILGMTVIIKYYLSSIIKLIIHICKVLWHPGTEQEVLLSVFPFPFSNSDFFCPLNLVV